MDADGDEATASARTWASLRIFDDDLDPDAVTAVLGIEPTDSFRRGDEHGQHRDRRKFGGWFLTSRDVVESRDLRPHVDWLLDAVEPARDAFIELLAAGARADVFCFWESVEGGPTLAPPQMGRLAQLGLSIGIDVYRVSPPD